jgi:hypothetical protein
MAFHWSALRRLCVHGARPVLVAALFSIVAMAAGMPAWAQQRPSASPQMRQEPGSRQMPQAQQQRGPDHPRGAVSADFRTALDPHGRWQRHARFGDVWVPSNRGRDWRPYTVGRWAYTDDWGWYWAEDREEADWGWVTYHYGRWVDDADLGWAWIPGNEWGPGFVQWRHGGDRIGWAPLPPDDIVVEYRERPDVWIFVRERDFVTAPRLAAVILPVRDYPVLVRETIVVNQTVVFREGTRFAVNPGIPATVIAAAVGRPIRAFDVRPRVLAGTAQIPGAIEVRAQDLRSGRFRAEPTLRETRNEIRATGSPQRLQPLAAGEHGRLGDNPPRAAQRLGQQQGQRQPPAQQPPSQQQGQQQPPATQQQPQQQQGQQQGRGKQEPAQTQGRGTEQREPAQQGKRQPQQQQGQQQLPQQRQQQQGRGNEPAETRGQRAPVQTQGRGSEEQRQQRSPQQSREGERVPPPQSRQGTEGRSGGRVDTQRPLTTQPRGSESPRQAQPERGGNREQGTSGRGGAEQARPRSQERGPQRSAPSASEGRGGGGGGVVHTAPQGRERGPAGGGATEGRGGGAGGPGGR